MQTCEIYCRKSINKKITSRAKTTGSSFEIRLGIGIGIVTQLWNACAYLWRSLCVPFAGSLLAFTICMRTQDSNYRDRERERETECERETRVCSYLSTNSVLIIFCLFIILFRLFTFYFIFISILFYWNLFSSLKFRFRIINISWVFKKFCLHFENL